MERDKCGRRLDFDVDQFPAGTHVCYIYNDDEERRHVMANYLAAGLAAKERVLYLVATLSPKRLIDWLLEDGCLFDSDSPALTVAEAVPAYCLSGAFHAGEMLGFVRRFYLQGMADGYTGVRGTGEMSWCRDRGNSEIDEIFEYEAGLNILIREHPLRACCQYDTRHFDGRTIFEVLRVHPLAIIRGQLVRNPYYVEPETYLEELRARRAA
jgi:hypothetical protein